MGSGGGAQQSQCQARQRATSVFPLVLLFSYSAQFFFISPISSLGHPSPAQAQTGMEPSLSLSTAEHHTLSYQESYKFSKKKESYK
jgi:hypothetical protein